MDKELKRKLIGEILTPKGFLFNREKAVDDILALDEMTPEAQEQVILEAKIKEKAELEAKVAEAQEILEIAIPRLEILTKELPNEPIKIFEEIKVKEEEIIEDPIEEPIEE